jgi:hypothetical protein
MTCYLLVTTPEYDVDAAKEKGGASWTCSKSTRAGDRLFVYVAQGIGLALEWRATSDARKERRWGYECDVAWVRDIKPALSCSDLIRDIPRQQWAPPHLHFRGYSSIQVPSAVEDYLDTIRPPKRPRSEQGTLASTRHAAGAVSKLSATSLAAEFAAASHVGIASAFYDVPALRLLLQRSAKKPSRTIRVLLNGLGGDRLATQKQELTELASSLSAHGDRLDIRLAFEPAIFHTKLFYARSEQRCRAWIGSANATSAALVDTSNEELMVGFETGASRAIAYFESVFNDSSVSKPLSAIDDDLPARSLVAFFRAGSLFFKPQVSLQKTFSPFSTLLGSLPQEEKAKFARRRIEYADAAAGIGPFNIVRALRNDRTSAIQDEDSADEEKTKVSLRPYALETCLGYWVPSAYVPLARGLIERARGGKEAQLAALFAELKRFGWEALAKRYEQYLASAEEVMKELEIPWKKYIGQDSSAESVPWGASDPFESMEAFRRVYSRMLDSLENHRERLSSPFVETDMPEIWTDPVATEAFINTAFEYLSFVSEKARWHKSAGAILVACRAPEGVAPDDLRSAMTRLLRAQGWRRSNWPGVPDSELESHPADVKRSAG